MRSAHSQGQRPVDSRADAALRRRRLLAHLLLGSALLLCAMLLLYPPTRFSFYPACPIHEFLGFDCPGCGATRALAALLRGHLAEALHLNPLFVLLLPAALAIAVESYRRAIRPGRDQTGSGARNGA